MMQRNYLIWMDLEMTGLDVSKDQILEIATVITDTDLEIIDRGPVLAVFQEAHVLADMSDWSREHHNQSGLTDRVENSKIDLAEAENQTFDFIQTYAKKGEAPLCGNSIHQDRLFLAKYMPKIDKYLHYRNIDVSSIKELVHRWYPDLKKFKKANNHNALDDIIESVAELKYYREKVFIDQLNV